MLRNMYDQLVLKARNICPMESAPTSVIARRQIIANSIENTYQGLAGLKRKSILNKTTKDVTPWVTLLQDLWMVSDLTTLHDYYVLIHSSF